MPKLKIAVQLRSLRQPLRQALPIAASLGAEGVEIDARVELRPSELSQTAVRQLRKQLEDLNLRVAALSFRTRRGYDTLDDLDRRVEATKEALRAAHALGATYVLNAVGAVPARDDDPRWSLLVDVLSDLGAFGNRVGAMLAAETGSESPAELLRLIDRLPAGSLAVSLDPASLVLRGYDPHDAVATLGSHFVHVTARDATPDRTAAEGFEVPLGRGTVDFPALLAELEQRDYRGYFTVAREHSADPARELGQAIQYLRNL